MDSLIPALLCFLVMVALAIYWTIWKIRAELNQNMGKMVSELGDIRKSLEKKPGGA